MREILAAGLVAGLALHAGCKKNQAPDTPAVPSGPTSCAVGVQHAFSSSTDDVDDDSVAMRFDWGDGDTSYWSDFAHSGDSASMSHSWASAGTYAVAVQAKDGHGAVSAWSSASSVSASGGWARTFGGTDWDEGRSVCQTQDGGYIVVGYTYSFGAGNSDVWLVKTDASGCEVWAKAYGGPGWEEGYSVGLTQDGGYIITGWTDSYGAGGHDVWLIRVDASGNELWDRTFGGAEWDEGHSVLQALDGGYVIVGRTESFGSGPDLWLIKVDDHGSMAWSNVLGGPGADWGNSVHQTLDGSLAITGVTNLREGAGDVWLLKTDSDGNQHWSRSIDHDYFDEGASVHQTSDGGYVIAGTTEPSAESLQGCNGLLVRTDPDGRVIWERVFGGPGHDWCSSVTVTAAGGYVVVMTSFSDHAGNGDVWLYETDARGDTTRRLTFGGRGQDEVGSVLQSSDGGYVIAGSTASYGAGSEDFWLIKIDAEGDVDEGGAK